MKKQNLCPLCMKRIRDHAGWTLCADPSWPTNCWGGDTMHCIAIVHPSCALNYCRIAGIKPPDIPTLASYMRAGK